MSSTIFSMYRSFKLVQSPFLVFSRNQHKKPIKVSWKKPEVGWTKLNFDGSYKSGKASIGGVIRDHNANFLLGYAEPIETMNSTIAEFAALKRGLELVLENGYTDRLWLEGDNKTLVNIINEKKDAFKCVEVQKLVGSISLIIPEFKKCLVTHVYRQGNRVADKFTKIGHELKQPQVWVVPPSEEVMKILKEDANGKVILRKR